MCAKWTKDPKDFTHYAEALLKRIWASAIVKGEQVSFSDPFNFHENQSVLVEGIEFDPTIPSSEQRGLVWKSLLAAAKSGKTKPAEFLNELTRFEEEYKRRPPARYYLLSSVSVKWRPKLAAPAVRGTSTRFYLSAPKGFDQSVVADVIRSTFHHRELPNNYTYARVGIQARGAAEAAERSFDALELFRGSWNLFINLHYSTRLFSGRATPINTILPGPFSTLHDSSGRSVDQRIWYDPGYVEPHSPHDFRNWKEYTKHESWLFARLKRHRYRNHVEEMIRRYSSALDGTDYDVVINKLWSLLERGASAGDKYESIVRRVSFLFADVDFARLHLEHLRRYRNRVIHAAHSSEQRNEAVHQLRRFVQAVLLFHIRNVDKAASISEACEFLDLPTESKVLRRRLRLIERAVRFRTSPR
ncbi:MAG TPA: hypothetical protein VH370_01965 [Humisphaera sp.]|jgi:hypothetical protein|nr:hypothetical protein [Humisphaera sp.]